MADAAIDRLGRPLRDLRISVTDRCNFRCPYCMPAEVFGENYTFLPRAEILTFEEIERLTRLFVSLGVRKVRVTGGEPLLRRELPALIRRLTAIDGVEDLTLTTNGYLLPRMAGELKGAGLHRMTVSLDSLDEDVFERLNGRGYHVSQVLAGIRSAEAAGFAPLKINAVVQRGVNDHTVVDLARHFSGTGHIVRFIEYMDVGNRNGWRLDQVVPAAEIVRRIHEVMPVTAVAPNYPGEVARRYRYLDGSGEIGVIASVTQPFCGDCTRARLSTDGKVYTCLFSGTGVDLRDPLRDGATDDALLATISEIWDDREDRYSELRTAETAEMPSFSKVEMYQIGG
ncbi:MAG: GTP 3',8-cyclase MoaA [Gemmatimonadota bacterium]|nr:GTP 3',8-cyclase MoaA [Gemmatimonadota bacterium]